MVRRPSLLALSLVGTALVLLARSPALGEDTEQVVFRVSLVELPRQDDAVDVERTADVRHVAAEADALRRLFALLGERDGAKTLAEPSVVTMMGNEASLFTGGEFPIPVLDSNGDWKQEFKEFGTRVNLTPTRTEKGPLHVELEMKVSEQNFEKAVTLDGVKVPGLTVRAMHVTVDVERGEAILLIAEHEDATRLLFVHPEHIHFQDVGTIE